MDARRQRRAHVVDNRYDFTFADKRARKMAWHGHDPVKQTLVTKGYQALQTPKHVRRKTMQTAQQQSIERSLAAARHQHLDSLAASSRAASRAKTAAKNAVGGGGGGGDGPGDWSEFQRGWSEGTSVGTTLSTSASSASYQPATVLVTAAQQQAERASAGLRRTQSLFALSDNTHVADGTGSGLLPPAPTTCSAVAIARLPACPSACLLCVCTGRRLWCSIFLGPRPVLWDVHVHDYDMGSVPEAPTALAAKCHGTNWDSCTYA